MRVPDLKQTGAAVIVGLVLGVLPHALGFLFGFANVLLTPVLVPVLAIVAGARLARPGIATRWAAVILTGLVTGGAYVGAWYAQLAVLARINGAWLDTLPALQAAQTFAGVATLGIILTGLGALFGARKGRSPARAEKFGG